MIHIFTPSFADENDTNAQNLTVKEIVARLDSHEFRITMLAEDRPDARIAQRPNTRLLGWRKRGNTARTIAALLREPPDIYFFPREGPLDAVFLALQPYLFRHTVLVTYFVSGGLYNPDPVAPGKMRNIARAAVVVGNNAYLSELAAKRFQVPVTTIHDGADPRFFFPAGLTIDPPVVLFAGSLRPYKRAAFMVQLAASRPHVRFRLAGTGEDEAMCRKIIAERSMTNVEFLGHLSPGELGEEMRRSSILFHPSILEGHPQVFIQAAACGLPVVALDLYHPDAVVNGETGFLAVDDADLESCLDRLLADSGLRRTMSEKSLAHAKSFSWDDAASRWRTCFLDAMAKRKER